MCGIVGAVAKRDVGTILLDGLKRLEYRGYDSAGIVIVDQKNHLLRHRVLGKVSELEKIMQETQLPGSTGIAHTRWATHGKPSIRNAHPHIAGNEIALVHNGIIENHEKIRHELLEKGCTLHSQTDSELIVHLVYGYIAAGQHFLAAVRSASQKLSGAFAIGFVRRFEPDRLIAIRNGSPLVIGLGIGENFIASDPLALLSVTHRFIYLEDGDLADISASQITIYNKEGKPVHRPIHVFDLHEGQAEKGKYRHFMLKEIFEQPDAVAATLEGRIAHHRILTETFGETAPAIFSRVRRVQIVACGTSYHAGLIAQHWFEEIAGLPCQVEIASEYRYRHHIIEPDTLFISISQSGETADTLAALRLAKKHHYSATLSICNKPGSSLVRESGLVLMTHAGPEIGVASTKAFTTQLAALFLLTIVLGREHKRLDTDKEVELVKALIDLPNKIHKTLALNADIKKLTGLFVHKHHCLFLGRGLQVPVAMEGALKLKEISYIHAEAYAAGELKHGPLALVDANMPVVTLVPMDGLLDKLKSNLQEVLARGGKLILFADKKTGIEGGHGIRVITMPSINKHLAPVLYSVAMQLLAYHVAVRKGTNVDQPRNLAKSVTVE